MKTSEDLKQFLRAVDRKGYPAYKDAKGVYQFPGYDLWIDHVQGDPFASPSRITLRVSGEKAGFLSTFYDKDFKRTALEDFLLRKFGQTMEPFRYKAKGSGKSGLIEISRPGPEILKRTACTVDALDGKISLRLEVGFPAKGRTIDSGELIRIFFDFLPVCVAKSCFYGSYSSLEKEMMKEAIRLSEDQEAIRFQLSKKNLIAFVANGAILPRQSGVSKKTMANAVPFQSPKGMEVEMDLPNRGKICGMGIKKGVTLIVGGGYHGKTTLLKALECGVYNHISGDGRELVITDKTAVKLRAEDGRSVKQTDISLFITNLPNKRDTVLFCTEDASGSTSSAAGVVEAIESGSNVFFIDEDTSATNFMIRDRLMQKVVSREKEPITPFVERVRGLYEEYGISTVLVAGSSGSYFYTADTVIQMDSYVPEEITSLAREAANAFGEEIPVLPMPRIHLERIPSSLSLEERDGRCKIKCLGSDSLQIGKEILDLRYVEQLVELEQIKSLGYILSYAAKHLMDKKRTLTEIVDVLEDKINKEGLVSLSVGGYLSCDLALPRRQEIFSAFNRCRNLNFVK